MEVGGSGPCLIEAHPSSARVSVDEIKLQNILPTKEQICPLCHKFYIH